MNNILKKIDKSTEIIIYFIIIFSSWAFGATEQWSTNVVNFSVYTLGIITLLKIIFLKFSSTNKNEINYVNFLKLNGHKTKKFHICLIILFSLLIIYVLISFINAKATFNSLNKEYNYYSNYKSYLPHSYDQNSTFESLNSLISFTIIFYSTLLWLKSCNYCDRNIRTKKLIMVIIYNASIIAFTGIIQKIYYGNLNGKLLFLIEPNINKSSLNHFGPFAYRSNACAYINLIWPIAIGYYIHFSKKNLNKFGSGNELLILPSVGLLLSCPIISSSRGGTLILIILSFMIIILLCNKKYMLGHKSIKYSITFTIFICLIFSYLFGWNFIEERFDDFTNKIMQNDRLLIYANTINMIKDYGHYGSGPGTFETIYQFELNDLNTVWESWAHNDYLETLLTFGTTGSIIIILIIMNIILICFKIKSNIIKVTYYISVLGLFTHAAFDFPLQTYSILLMLSILTAVIGVNKIELV